MGIEKRKDTKLNSKLNFPLFVFRQLQLRSEIKLVISEWLREVHKSWSF